MVRKNAAGAGGMPVETGVKEIAAGQAISSDAQAAGELEARRASCQQKEEADFGSAAPGFEAQAESASDYAARQPDFRVVQPEYNSIEGKTIFKDVGALWKNISKKTGREFYTMKIGKLKLLVFPNQKLVQTE